MFMERAKGLVIKSVLSKQHDQSWRNPKTTRKIFPPKREKFTKRKN